MKSEKEIRALVKAIAETGKDIPIVAMVNLTDKGGHWLDCLEWVLK